MRVLRSYAYGIREATIQPKMISVLWLINLLFSTVLFYTVFNFLAKTIGKSQASDILLQRLDFNYVFELLVHHGGAIRTILCLFLILIFVYSFVSIFLNGGILFTIAPSTRMAAVEKRGERFAGTFFQGAGKFFGRFFRLCIYSLLLWVLFIILHVLLNLVFRPLTSGGTNEQMMLYLFWVRLAIGLFLILLIRMILDYTRIKIVLEDTHYVSRSLLQTIGFVFRNFGKTLALYYLLIVTAVILGLIYWGLKSLIVQGSLFPILTAFIIGQIFILSRGWLKIALQAAQMEFYSQ
jgi:hypothetical protein